MASARIQHERPPMWQIERSKTVPPRDILQFGRHRIPLDDIAAVSGEEEGHRPVGGLMLAGALFLMVASVLVFGVFEGGWQSRYLIGAAFLAFLGSIGCIEVLQIGRQSLYRLRLTLTSGDIVMFATADRADIERLMARLQASA